MGRENNTRFHKIDNQSTLPYKSINHGRRSSCETIREEEFPEQILDLSLGERIKNMFKGGRNPDSDTKRKRVQWSDLDEKGDTLSNKEGRQNNPRSSCSRDTLRKSLSRNTG